MSRVTELRNQRKTLSPSKFLRAYGAEPGLTRMGIFSFFQTWIHVPEWEKISKHERTVVVTITQIVPLDMKGCICHFTKWQIHPFIYKGAKCSHSKTVITLMYFKVHVANNTHMFLDLVWQNILINPNTVVIDWNNFKLPWSKRKGK